MNISRDFSKISIVSSTFIQLTTKMCKLVTVIVALALFGLSVFAATDDELKLLDTKLTNNFDKCKTSSGVTEEHYKSLFKGETPLKGKAGCFVACVGKEMDLVKANNTFDKDKVSKYMELAGVRAKQENIEEHFNAMKKMVDSCLAAQQGGDDACLIAKNLAECIAVGVKKTGLLQ